MTYWWVNQNQTYKHEIGGGYLWSPKTNAGGRRNPYYDNMRNVRPGDVVLSFSDTRIRAIGVATGKARESPMPSEFGSLGDNWNVDGWLVPVEFTEMQNPIRPKDYIESIRPLLPEKYSPLQASGNGQQNLYLTQLSDELATFLLELCEPAARHISETAEGRPETDDADDRAESALEQRTDIGATQKLQLVMARRGQGVFRANVRLIESRCRITGLKVFGHLRASHIKPWRVCSDQEKLDGNNGLLLSPHIDHLFDCGYITFEDNGDLVCSAKLRKDVLAAWGITFPFNCGSFNDAQRRYLKHHRTVELKPQKRTNL